METWEAWFQIWDMDPSAALPEWTFVGWIYAAPCFLNEVFEGRFTIHNADGTLYNPDRECVPELGLGGTIPHVWVASG